MLIAEKLRKSYTSRVVVADVSLSVQPGELLALLGPNGAGKSTAVSMLAGLVRPDAGTVTIGGQRVTPRSNDAKRRIGLVPQDIALYDTASALGNLAFFGALYGVTGKLLASRAHAALVAVGLADRAADAPSTFSGGMKRRLNIACALVHDPDVLLLDEPTAGVDPQSRNAIFEQIGALKSQGKALVYTTHYMEEAARLADRIVIIDHGRVVASGTLDELLRLLPAAGTLVIDCDGRPDLLALGALPGVTQVAHAAGRLTLGIADLGATAPVVLAELASTGCVVRQIASGRADLEDVFLTLTGRQLRD